MSSSRSPEGIERPRKWPAARRFIDVLVRHVAGALSATLLILVVDAVLTIVDPQSRHIRVTDLAIAEAHLLALVSPFALLVGVASAVAATLLPTMPQVSHTLERIVRPWRWFSPDPAGFALATTVLAAAIVGVLGVQRAAVAVLASFHDTTLAAWAIGLLAVAIAVGVLVLALGLFRGLCHVLPHLGPASSFVVFVAILVQAVVAVSMHVRENAPTFYRSIDPWLVWLPVAALVVHLAVALPWRDVGTMPGRRAYALLLVILALGLGLVVTLATYGARQAERKIVEDISRVGRSTYRAYLRVFDRDGDGTMARLGGHDCREGDASVHPGADDPEGDGIDADCFGGDGTPPWNDAGDGHYGRRPPSLDRPNILLVTIDALRPDHLQTFGYHRPVSPHIDTFAREAVRFRSASAAAPRTVRSVAALLTGKYPGQIAYGAVHLWPEMLPENVTLPELLADRYRTAAVLGSSYFSDARGYDQGFEQVSIPPAYKPNRAYPTQHGLTRLEELAAGEEPWFLWVHYFNVHEPYLADGTPSRFGPGAIGAYDTEVSLADVQVGELLTKVRTLGLWDETVVILASDHGESLGSPRPMYGHSTTVYEDQIASLLLVRVPGIAPRTVDTPVALFDVFPTVLNLVDVPVPEPIPARSLVPLMNGDTRGMIDRPIFMEVFPDGTYALESYAVRIGNDKLVYSPTSGRYELYDLARTPDETRDLADREPGRARRLLDLLRRWQVHTHRPENRTSSVVASAILPDLPPSVQVRPRAVFNDEIELVGIELPANAQRGRLFPLDLYFRALARPRSDYWMHVTFAGPPQVTLPPTFEAHHQPVNGRYRTSRWRQGELIRDRVWVRVPEQVPAGIDISVDFAMLDDPPAVLSFRQDGRTDTTLQLGTISIR